MIKESKKTATLPKGKSYIKYNLRGKWYRARVLSSQPKRTGQNKDWVNLLVDGNRETTSVNWKEVSKWSELNSPEFPIYLCEVDMYSQEVIDAKAKEIDNLKDNDVFEEVLDIGQSTISSRWVLSERIKRKLSKRD